MQNFEWFFFKGRCKIRITKTENSKKYNYYFSLWTPSLCKNA
jgi:hypothetical protein